MSTKEAIVKKAHKFLDERVASLLSDVRYCILRNKGSEDWPAPLPALLYCFSTIDLMGALHDGNAISHGTISKRSLNYMRHVMKYPKEESSLLQDVFRHKIVHLAQLQPRVIQGDEVFTWKYFHNNREQHLKIDEVNSPEKLFRFNVSIYSLAEDIATSVKGADGYYERLNQKQSARDNFEKAYGQIFE